MSAFVIELSASHDSGGVFSTLRVYWGDSRIEKERPTVLHTQWTLGVLGRLQRGAIFLWESQLGKTLQPSFHSWKAINSNVGSAWDKASK